MRTDRDRPVSTGSSRFDEDERGAIVLIGIGAGAVLAFGLFHMVHVTEAALWREGLQNAADAAAFDNAALQARGMNVIVMFNLVMSAVMAVLLALRIAELLLALGLVIGAIASFFTGGGASSIEIKMAEWEAKLLRNDPKVADRVMRVCAGINVLEKVVATVTPPYATFHSTTKTWDDYPVHFVLALNPSIAPTTTFTKDGVLDPNESITKRLSECKESLAGAKGATKPPKPPASAGGKTWETFAQRRMGLIFSLPVQEDRLGVLCKEASNRLFVTLPSLLTGIDFDWNSGPVGKYKDKLFSFFPSLFCAPASSGVNSVGTQFNDFSKGAVRSSCNKQADDFYALPEKERNGSQFDKGGKFDMDKCIKGAEKNAKNKDKDARDNALKRQDNLLKCVKPAKVWESAQNGQFPMQSFSWAYKVSTGPTSSVIRAQAEMYFDCNKGWIGGCDSTAMWKPDWRARLRRIQRPVDMLLDTASVAMAGMVANGLQKFIGEGAAKIPGLDKLPLVGSKLQTFVSSGTSKVPLIGTDVKYGSGLGQPRDGLQGGIQGILQDLLPDRNSADSEVIH
ncbi:MAG: hypothetical protein QM784_21490 [Polyangiaceae bacterium]